jgi:beta-lactamase regulating signal transducer with metallopeptidase domain
VLGLCLAVFLTRGAFLFLLVYGINKAMPGLPAGFRHGLWFVVVCSFFFLPAARLLLPAVTLEGARALAAQSAGSYLLAPFAFRQTLETALVGGDPAFALPLGNGGLHAAWLAVCVLYLCGVAYCLARQLTARKMLRDLARGAHSPAGWQRLARGISGQMRIHRRVSLLVHERVAVPFTYAFLAPRILLPESSKSWPAQRLRAVLAHELAHVKRGDSLLNLVAFWVCAVLWFLPPAWFAWRFMRKEAEISCDLSVLDLGFKRTAYASTILDLGAANGNGLILATHSFFGDRGMIRERIQRILRPDAGPRSGLRERSRGVLVSAALMVLALFLLAGSLKVTERLFGTWSNCGLSGPARYEWSDSGIGLQYARSSTCGDLGTGRQFARIVRYLPSSVGPFVIEKDWTDRGGNTWYEVKTRWSSLGAPRYALIKLDASGAFYESDESPTGYPSAFKGPLGTGMHLMFTRQ